MEPITFTYDIDIKDYRRMLYFNTFQLKRFQTVVMALVWLASATLLILELLYLFSPTPIMHLCFLIVTVAIPMLFVSVEIRVSRSKGVSSLTNVRSVTFSSEGLRFRGGGQGALEKWSDFQNVYDTKHMFIFYKDQRTTMLIPKRNEPSDKLEKACAILREFMGVRYIKRS